MSSTDIAADFGSTALGEDADTVGITELRAAFGGDFIANLGDLADDPAKYIQPGTAPVNLNQPVLTKAKIGSTDVMARFTILDPAPDLRYVSRGHNITRDDRTYLTFNAMLTNVNCKVEYRVDDRWYTLSELMAVLSGRYDAGTWRQLLSQFGIRVEGEHQERSAQSLSLQLLAASQEEIDRFWSIALTKWGGVEESIRAPRNQRTDRRGQLDMGIRFGTKGVGEPKVTAFEIGTTDRSASRAFRMNPATGGVGFTTLPQQVIENVQRVLGSRRAVAALEAKAEQLKAEIQGAMEAHSKARNDRDKVAAREALDEAQEGLTEVNEQTQEALRRARSWATHLGGAQPGFEFHDGADTPEEAAVPTGQYFATPAPCGRFTIGDESFNFWTRRDEARTVPTDDQRDETEVIRATPTLDPDSEDFGEVRLTDEAEEPTVENVVEEETLTEEQLEAMTAPDAPEEEGESED